MGVSPPSSHSLAKIAVVDETSMDASVISRNVAVIGAGAAGLVAARELRREGHRVVAFERESRVGGTWVYAPRTEPDPLGTDPGRAVVHSSLYKSLRTNLPREVMGFGDYPFLARADGSGDPRRYPGHEEVLAYLEDFAREFGLEEMVRFEKEVVGVGMVEEGGKWKVHWRMRNGGGGEEEVFDAVVVCNGHFTEPRIAEIPGCHFDRECGECRGHLSGHCQGRQRSSCGI